MNPLEEVVADLKVWATDENREIQTVVDKGGVMVIDFNGGRYTAAFVAFLNLR